MSETGVVNIRGKAYNTVAKRIKAFHEDYSGTAHILTELVDVTDEKVVVRAKIVNEAYQVLSTGHAEEFRAISKINADNAMEVAETSAIGRALANLGYLGSDIASDEEIKRAQAAQEPVDPELIKTLEEAAGMGLEQLQTAWKLLTEEQRKQVGVARKDALKVLANGNG